MSALNDRNIKGLISLLGRTVEGLSKAENKEQSLSVAIEEITNFTGWPVGHAYIYDKDLDRLIPSDLWHLEGQQKYKPFCDITREKIFKKGEGLPGLTFDSKKGYWIYDLEKNKTCPRAKAGFDIGLMSGIGIPVVVGGEVYAVLEFFTREIVEEDHSLLAMLEEMARIMTSFMELREAEDKAKLANRELKSREGLQKTIMDTMVDGLIAISVRGKILFVNPMVRKIFGYEEGELIGRDIRTLMPKEDVKFHERAVAHYLKTGKSKIFGKGPVETRGLHKSGKVIDMELAIAEGEYNGQLVFIGSMRDITRGKVERAEAAVLARQYQLLADYGNDIVVLRDSEARILYISPSLKRHLGLDPEKFIGAATPMALSPDDRKPAWQRWKKTVYEKKKMYRDRVRLMHKKGHEVWFDVIAVPVLDDKGRVTRVVTACRNIDDQIKAEEEQVLLGRIVEESPAEIYVFDPETLRILYANDQACKNLGYSQKDLKKRTMTGIKVGPTVKEGKKHLQPLLDGKKKNVRVKARQKRKNGSIYDFEAIVHLSRTGDKPVLVSLGQDVTEINKAHEETRTARERYKFLADNIHDIIIHRTPEGEVLYVTPSFERLLGYKVQDILHSPTWQLIHPEERKAIKKQWKENILEKGRGFRSLARLSTRDGEYLWFEADHNPIKDEKGKVVSVISSSRDVNDRVEAEEKIRLLAENTNDIIFLRDATGKLEYITPSIERATGFKIADTLEAGKIPWDFLHPEDRKMAQKVWQEIVIKKGQPVETEIRLLHADGGYYWYLASTTPIKDKKGRVTGAVTSCKYIHEQKLATEKIQLLADNTDDIIALCNRDGSFQYITPSIFRHLGYKPEEKLGSNPLSLMHPDDRETQEKLWVKNIMEDETAYSVEVRLGAKSGNYLWFLCATVPIMNENGERTGGVHSCKNIHEQKLASKAKEAAEKRFRMLIEYSNDIITHRDHEGKIIYISPAFKKHLGYDPGNFIGKKVTKLMHPDDRRTVEKEWEKTALRKGKTFRAKARLKAKDGQYIWFDAVTEPVRDKKGKVIYSITTTRNIDDQLKAEDEKTRLGAIIEDSLNEIYVFDTKTLKFDFVNRGARENLGYKLEKLKKMTPLDIKPEFTAESFSQLLKPLRSGELDRLNFETKHLRKDGSTYDVEIHMQLSHSREKPVFVAITEDVTEKKKAAEQLRQAQKMEVVGQLTGGVAHDFNNLLTAIQGGLQLLEMMTDLDDDAQECVDLAVRSAKRGAELTHRLLAFSRTQSLNPKVVDANSLMADMLPLLKRTIKESVEIEIHPMSEPAPVEVDVSEMENAILNLSVNARDAIPDGGKLIFKIEETLVEKAQAEKMEINPGNYIVLIITDTGTGMPEDVVKKIFEPFFTTKEVGKGTGLGLSMIYGFVKQSGGHITVDSKPGEGTTFKMFLPKAVEKAKEADEKTGPVDFAKQEQGTILLVEDDQEVRTFVCRALMAKGYNLLCAEHGPKAIKIMNRGLAIDLLLTDVVLPKGMDGREVAKEFAKRYPDAKILYSSGYAGKTLTEDGRLPKGVELLAKPYDPSELFERIGSLLNS